MIKWIEDIKISKDGRYIAFGTHGCKSSIELWDVEENTGIIRKFFFAVKPEFESGLNHLDWSHDSRFVIATSETYELKFYDI